MAPEDRDAGPIAVASQLQQRIDAGEFDPGSRLPSERALANHYGVARSVVREALSTLSERRLISIEPARGAFVRAPQTTDAAMTIRTVLLRQSVTARQVLSARRLVEGETAYLAAGHRSVDDLSAMQSALRSLESAPILANRVGADLQFHTAIARAAQNPVLATMFGSIAGLTADLMLRSLTDREVTDDALPQHRDIFEAVESRDGPAARDHMSAHLRIAEQHYGRDLELPLAEVVRRRLADVGDDDRAAWELTDLLDRPFQPCDNLV